MVYNPGVSKIKDVELIKNSMKNTVDLVKLAEIEYERMRQLNYTTERAKPIKQTAEILKNVALGFSGSRVVGSIQDKNYRSQQIESALIETISSLFSRAVGPIEDLPARQYMLDRVRATIVATKTQIRKEQEIIAKFMQARGNKYVKDPDDIKIRSAGMSNIGPYTIKNAIDNPLFGYANQMFPFSIMNLASGVRESFPPFISTLNESLSTSWNEVFFLNRSEGVPIYQNASRSFTMDFLLFATNGNESISIKKDDFRSGFPIYPQPIEGVETNVIDFLTKQDMWKKINFLQRCTRPSYVDGLYSKSPYCRLTIGHLFQDILMTIDGISLNYDPLIWDLNVDKINENDTDEPKFRGIKPMIVAINMSGKLYHNAPPSSSYIFYLDKRE